MRRFVGVSAAAAGQRGLIPSSKDCMRTELLLSPHSITPMYVQIMEQVVAKVMAGEWKAGAPLPSIRELAAGSQVSVITVKRAYLELERAGVIVTRQGKGSFVAETLDATQALAAQEFQSQLAGLLDTARKLGLDRQQIIDRVEQALSSEPGTSAPTNPDRRKPG
ncbi:GntR family transcriptional regulator [Pseudoxanthomonas sp.]|jgi:Predicted transcriptional regulators|uniref:GntR family transcriptional regulator n=1 Tax=Pseudoxanthomonas sp. TaxID=1871049 RepID=UPI002FE09F95